MNIASNYGSIKHSISGTDSAASPSTSRRARSLSVDSQLDFIEPEWVKKWKVLAIGTLCVSTVYLTTRGFNENWYGTFEDWAADNEYKVQYFLCWGILTIPYSNV